MGIENRIKSLREKHAAAAAQIQLLELSPRPDSMKIAELKKLKLKYKDEIVRLENPNRLTAPKAKKHKQPSKSKKKQANGSKSLMVSETPYVSDREIDLAA